MFHSIVTKTPQFCRRKEIKFNFVIKRLYTSLITLIQKYNERISDLVVDDEEDLCEILKFNLENEGYEVDTANSAEDALKMDISTYDLLLLDVMMGEISGFKMASMLKKEKKTAKIPIIFITAKDTEMIR